jgi:hypothetical protein
MITLLRPVRAVAETECPDDFILYRLPGGLSVGMGLFRSGGLWEPFKVPEKENRLLRPLYLRILVVLCQILEV